MRIRPLISSIWVTSWTDFVGWVGNGGDGWNKGVSVGVRGLLPFSKMMVETVMQGLFGVGYSKLKNWVTFGKDFIDLKQPLP